MYNAVSGNRPLVKQTPVRAAVTRPVLTHTAWAPAKGFGLDRTEAAQAYCSGVTPPSPGYQMVLPRERLNRRKEAGIKWDMRMSLHQLRCRNKSTKHLVRKLSDMRSKTKVKGEQTRLVSAQTG